MQMLRSFLLVGAGGAIGSMARYGIAYAMSKGTPETHIATFLINIVGSLLIGLLFGMASRQQLMAGGAGWLFLASGLCGGFTTFSTFALENVSLMQKGQSVAALTYTLASVVVGLLLCRVGMWMTGQ
jgi:CrcB protein